MTPGTFMAIDLVMNRINKSGSDPLKIQKLITARRIVFKKNAPAE